MKKRIVATILFFGIVCSLFQGAVFAAEEPLEEEDRTEVIQEEITTDIEDIEDTEESLQIEDAEEAEEPSETGNTEEEEPVEEVSDELLADAEVTEETDATMYEDASHVEGDISARAYSNYSPSSQYRNSVYYERLQTAIASKTYDQRQDILRIAYSQIGYHEGNSSSDLAGGNSNGTGNYTEYGSWYGLVNQAWCAMFISWCAYYAGIDTTVLPQTANAALGYFGSNYHTYNSSAVQPGDIIYFYSGTHVGLVYEKGDGYIKIIEGNCSDQVKLLQYSINDSRFTHYLSPNYQSSWRKIDGYWYYYDPDTNIKHTGWLTLGGEKYYFDPNNDGRMVTGFKQIDNYWYYFNSSGHMTVGWEEINGYWYYFQSNGRMYNSGLLEVGGKTYYIGSDGKMYTGFREIGDKDYYFREVADDNGPVGSMAKGWCEISDEWHFFDRSTGAHCMGWLQSGDYWFYLDPGNNGVMVTGWAEIAGTWYHFDSSGHRESGWIKPASYWYYLDPNNNDAMVTGWKMIGAYTYYFDDIGRMVTGWAEIAGTWYHFDSSGHRESGWIKPASYWYYLDPNNNDAMVTGWKVIDGDTYYFRTDSGMEGKMVTGQYTIDGVTYTFSSSGRLIG